MDHRNANATVPPTTDENKPVAESNQPEQAKPRYQSLGLGKGAIKSGLKAGGSLSIVV
jgi:hypothetical protein